MPRVEDAFLRAAGVHDSAAAVHDRAAKFFDARLPVLATRPGTRLEMMEQPAGRLAQLLEPEVAALVSAGRPSVVGGDHCDHLSGR